MVVILFPTYIKLIIFLWQDIDNIVMLFLEYFF